jgi:hypothetical protein
MAKPNKLITRAPCVECGEESVDIMIGWEGSKFCLCPNHKSVAMQNEAYFDTFKDETQNSNDSDRFKRRMIRCGLTESIMDAIGLSSNNTDPDLDTRTDAARRVKTFNSQLKQGVLVLSGFNGVGKSVAAGWASWKSRGRFMPRSEWGHLTTWERDADEILDLREGSGVLVFDEVLGRSEGGDSKEAMKVVDLIACERHDRRRATIITTRANKNEFYRAFNNDMLDRSREFSLVGGSGFIEVEGASLR